MKKWIISLLLIPNLLIAQKSNENEVKKAKVDASSGATWNGNSQKEKLFKGTISGKVIDDQTKKPLEFASVSLTDSKSNKVIEGTITNKKGRFIFENINIGDYKININFIGYKDHILILNTTKTKPDFKAKNIILLTDSELLSEITIEEEKAIYETRIDKIVYNAENDLNETENDATDVLRKAPLLSVDLEGNVSLRGSQNIKFLVNGKASTFFSSDATSALQMIPANEIKSVEVITTPGAKYDGDGDAGIINIITKRKRIDGYQATIKTGIGSKTTTGGLNFNIGKGRWGLSVNGGTWGSGFNKREGKDTYKRLDWNGEGDTSMLIKNGISESFFNGYRGSVNSFFDVNAYNSFNSSFTASGRTKPYNKTETSFYTEFGEETDTTIHSVEKTDRTIKIEWTTDYTKKFKKNEDRQLTIAFQIGGRINDGNTTINDFKAPKLLNQNDEKVIEETFQIDYIHPFGGKKRSKENKVTKDWGSRKERRGNKSSNLNYNNIIEIGAKMINRDREMIYSDMDGNTYTFSDAFMYQQLVYSSYISTEFSLIKGFGIKTGIRYENTNTKGNWLNYSNNPFRKNYTNLLPSIIISKSFSPLQSIKFSYNKRITRPSIREINTNTDKLDNNSITIGNPDLDPRLTEKYEIGLNRFSRLVQISLQLYHKYSTNIIESFLLEIDENGNSISEYRNIGESKQNGLGFFGSINLNKITSRSGFNIYSYSGRDRIFNNYNWTKPVTLYSYNFGGNFTFAKYWKAETFAFYRSPNQSIQGSITSFSMMSIGVKRVFKNKRGAIGIRLIEPFKENKDFTTNLKGDFFTLESIRSIPFRSIALSFNYTLGKLNFKDTNKKTKIKNDDIKQQSGGEY